MCHHRVMAQSDLLIHGGTVVDGPGQPGRPADAGVSGDWILADLVVFDPATVRDDASYVEPVRHPSGIEHVIVNGRPAILSGAETGERPGPLLRRS